MRAAAPSSIPYATEPRVVVGAEFVKRIDGVVFVNQYDEQHTIRLILTTGATITIKLEQERPRVRAKKTQAPHPPAREPTEPA